MAHYCASLITSRLFSYRDQASAEQPAVPSSQGKREKSPLPKGKRPNKKTVFTRKQFQNVPYPGAKLSRRSSCNRWNSTHVAGWAKYFRGGEVQVAAGVECSHGMVKVQAVKASVASLCSEPYPRWWQNEGSNSNKGNTWQSLSLHCIYG